MVGWLNPQGLVFLGFLIPLFLLYLIKPRPQRRSIPSLMFILKDTGRNPINRLFRNWFNDILFFFHLLIFVLLAGSLAEPFIDVPHSFSAQNSVIILDNSASMNAYFDEARDLAIDALSDENTIILVQNFPEVIAENMPATRAKRLLQDVDSKDTTTNLADALALVQADPATHVTIISDFLPSEGNLDVAASIEAIESKGALVTLRVLGKAQDNVGIIDLSVRDDTSKVWVKNYADSPADITLSIGDVKQDILLAKKETKEVSFQTPSGLTKVEIQQKDALMVDNTVWISTPSDNVVSMLVFTNNQEGFEKSNFKLALDIIQKNFPISIEVSYALWPKVPDLNHDIYVFWDSNPSLIIPGYIKDLKEQVEGGAALIITSQDGLFGIDFQGMMPVEYQGEGASAEVLAKENNLLTNDIVFGQVQTYDKVTLKEGVTAIAQAGDDPLLTINKLGKGTVFYYGYPTGAESFSAENSYPVFWRRVLDLATNRPTLRSLNVKTGSLVNFAKDEVVKTPTGKITTRLLRTDNAGLYELSDRTIAANVLSDLESNINRDPLVLAKTGIGESESDRTVPYELSVICLIAGLIILFLELLYIKFRGDF